MQNSELILSSPRPVKTVRQILGEMKYTEKVPVGSKLAQKIGNHVKLAICKNKKPLPKIIIPDAVHAYPAIPYDEEHWNVIKMIVRVTVAEEYLSNESKPESPFSVDESGIFGTEAKKLVINRNNVTIKYLFPLLCFEVPPSGRLKQTFECNEERDAYQQRIVDLMNTVWMNEKTGFLINLDEIPYVWCSRKGGNVNRVIADLTEIIRYKGNYGGRTLEDWVIECGQELQDSVRHSLHYKLEDMLGYKIYNRVLQKSNDEPHVPGRWPPIVLDKEEAQKMKELLIDQYILDEIASFVGVDGDFVSHSDDHMPLSTTLDTEQRIAKFPRLC